MAVQHQQIARPADLDDHALCVRSAAGDVAAFEELYRRHVDAAWRVAQAVAASADDAADAVAEAFTRLLKALASGRLSSDIPFRPYLLVTTRNVAIDQHRHSGRVRMPGDAALDRPSLDDDPADATVDHVDSGLVGLAFRSLPERWRTVLWLTEVEGIPAREVGVRLGMSANGTAQLAHRARAGLRAAYLQAHLQQEPDSPCAATVALLGAYAAGGLAPRATAAVDQHLAGCPTCGERLAHLADVGSSLRTIPLPLPASLAAFSVGRFRHLLPSSGSSSGARLVGRGATPGVTRSLGMSTGALLSIGVIAAGLMTNAGGPGAVRSSRSGGTAALAPAPPVATLPSAEASPATKAGAALASFTTASGPAGTDAAATASTTAGPDSGAPGSAPPSLPSSPTPPPSPAPAPSPSPAPAPAPAPAVVQASGGANAGVVQVSGALGVGGGCTATSVNNSPSCAPPAPTGPGVTASATTPVGSFGTAKTGAITNPSR